MPSSSDISTGSSAREKTTWGEVCSQVGFADNLYRTCRGKLGKEFSPANTFGSPYDEVPEEDEDFDRQIKKSALPVPPPPPEDWQYEPEGLAEQFMYGDLPGKILLYGGGAFVLYLLLSRFFSKPETASPKT